MFIKINTAVVIIFLTLFIPLKNFNAFKKDQHQASLFSSCLRKPTRVMPEQKNGERYNITAYGAIGDSTTLNTTYIQSAIDACAKTGGTVVIPKGIYLSGSIFLKPGVDLEIQEAGVLKGSTDINNYPSLMTRIEGHFEPWPAALVNADKADGLQITGPGTLDGSGDPFWKEFYHKRELDKKTTNLSVPRPRLAFIQHSKNVSISGIHFKNSGFWNLHLYRCQETKGRELPVYCFEWPSPQQCAEF